MSLPLQHSDASATTISPPSNAPPHAFIHVTKCTTPMSRAAQGAMETFLQLEARTASFSFMMMDVGDMHVGFQCQEIELFDVRAHAVGARAPRPRASAADAPKACAQRSAPNAWRLKCHGIELLDVCTYRAGVRALRHPPALHAHEAGAKSTCAALCLKLLEQQCLLSSNWP